MDCSGDCFVKVFPCVCTHQTGRKFIYTPEGLLQDSFLWKCMNQDKKYYCEGDCPVESAKYRMPGPCKGHRDRPFIKECWGRECCCDIKCGNWVVQRGIACKLQVCEDIPQVLDSDVPGLPERHIFLPRLLKLFQSPHSSLRKLSMGSVNQYIMLMPAALYASMDQYLQGLFVLANDPSSEVRKLML